MYVHNNNSIYRSTDVLNVQLMSCKDTCQGYIFFTPGFIRKVKIGFLFNQVNYTHFSKNISILNKKFKFSTSAKIGLSYDIKPLFQKSVNKKLQIFNSIFHPVLLHFFGFFYNDLIPLSNIFDHEKDY